MNTGLVTQEDLYLWTGHQKFDDMLRWLRDQGIEYTLGKGNRVCTTVDAINLRLVQKNKFTDIEFA